MDQVRPEAIRASSKASLACWNSRRGRCTQMADSSMNCGTPAAFAISKAPMFASWSMAQASDGRPVRDAIQEMTASNVSPANPKSRSEALSVTEAKCSRAPGVMVSSLSGRTTQVTLCPASTRASVVARPAVPVAPSTSTRFGSGPRGREGMRVCMSGKGSCPSAVHG